MKQSNSLVLVMLLSMVSLPAVAEERGAMETIWNDAFPEKRYYYGDRKRAIVGGIETAAGAGLLTGSYFVFRSPTASGDAAVAAEARDFATERLRERDPRAYQLLVDRDDLDRAISRQSAAIVELRRVLASGRIPEASKYDWMESDLTEWERQVHGTNLAAMDDEMPGLRAAQVEAQRRASPVDVRIDTEAGKLSNGTSGDQRAFEAIERAARRGQAIKVVLKKLAGGTLGIVGVYGVVDGPLRVTTALQGRRTGLSPAYNLGEAAIKYIVLTDEDEGDGSNGDRSRSGS